MTTFYLDSGGAATNSGSSDNNAPDLTGSAATVSGNVVSLDGSPNLSGLVTSGANQSTIFISQATNTNLKIFKITAFDNTAKTVTVGIAPTGVTSSQWSIGGQQTVAQNAVNAATAGDEVIVNNTLAVTVGTQIFYRGGGTQADGHIKIRAKTGVAMPVIENSGTADCIVAQVAMPWIEGLEIRNTNAATADAIDFNSTAADAVIKGCKISDAAVNGITCAGSRPKIIDNEITGVGGDAISLSATAGFATIKRNNIHNITGNGIASASNAANMLIDDNILDVCGGRGVYLSGAPTGAVNLVMDGNTIYGCADSGLEIADGDVHMALANNIFMNNGNAAGRYNVEVQTGNALLGIRSNNLYYHDGSGGGGNLSGITANATELTVDPLFVDAPNHNFALQALSPAKAAGVPGQFLGTSQGYRDMGAVQRQEPSSSATPRKKGS